MTARDLRRAARVAVSRRALLGLPAATLLASADAQGGTGTRWLPLDAGAVLQRIAFGSCLHQDRPQPIWRRVIETKPDLFLMLGDNVYGDVSNAALTELAGAYARQASHADFRAAAAAMSFLATWDDHDYGRNDAGADFPFKSQSRELFATFWGVPQAELPAAGIYRAVVIGPPGRRVQVILLDLRTFRSAFAPRPAAERLMSGTPGPYKPDPDPAKTMLGETQWAWLADELRVPAELRIVVSSIQLLADAHGFERWGHLPHELERFCRLVAASGAGGVIVISGDRHRAAIYRRTRGLPYPLYEITSSALNLSRAGAEPADAGRLTPMLAEDNFGLFTIDWPQRRLGVGLRRLSGIAGEGIEIGFEEIGL